MKSELWMWPGSEALPNDQQLHMVNSYQVDEAKKKTENSSWRLNNWRQLVGEISSHILQFGIEDH